MAFGKREDRTEAPSPAMGETPQVPSGQGASILGPNVHVEGNLTGSGTVRIEGNFKGKIIHEGQLVIAETANVEASMRVRELIISGRVEGDVVTTGRLELKPTARLVGSIKSSRVVISDGASLRGDCDVSSGDTASAVRQDHATAGPEAAATAEETAATS